MVNKLMIKDTDSVCEIYRALLKINLTIKRHDIDKII